MASLRTGLAKEEVEPRVGASVVKKAFQLEPLTRPSRHGERSWEDCGEWGRVHAHPQSRTASPSLCGKYGAAGVEAMSGGGRQAQMPR